MAERLKLRVGVAGPVPNGQSADFRVLAVEEAEGSVLTPGAIGATTLFTITDPDDPFVVQLLGTLQIQGSSIGWRRLAGVSAAKATFTLAATGPPRAPTQISRVVTPRNNGKPVFAGLSEEVWVGGAAADGTGGLAAFSATVSVTDATVGSADVGDFATLELDLDDFVLECPSP